MAWVYEGGDGGGRGWYDDGKLTALEVVRSTPVGSVHYLTAFKKIARSTGGVWAFGDPVVAGWLHQFPGYNAGVIGQAIAHIQGGGGIDDPYIEQLAGWTRAPTAAELREGYNNVAVRLRYQGQLTQAVQAGFFDKFPDLDRAWLGAYIQSMQSDQDPGDGFYERFLPAAAVFVAGGMAVNAIGGAAVAAEGAAAAGAGGAAAAEGAAGVAALTAAEEAALAIGWEGLAAESAAQGAALAEAGGVVAVGASMPAAVPETAAQLQAWGMVESAPGVWAQASATAGAAASGAAIGAAVQPLAQRALNELQRRLFAPSINAPAAAPAEGGIDWLRVGLLALGAIAIVS